jgi:hypothetical protein
MRIARIAGWILTAALALPGVSPLTGTARAQAAEEITRVGTPGHTMEWNAEAVASVADDLSKAVTEARRAAKAMPSPGIQSMQEVTWYHFNDKLRLIANEARQLAKSVRAGGTEEQVYPIYQRMWGWIRDAQDAGKRLMIPQDLQAKIDEARAQLDKLDAYFD